MPRLLFEKCGNAVWISHLDLMRLFQRAFKRAGLPLTHTQGFNPRPSVSIALPLSVGVESRCELLDFELNGEESSCTDICRALNECLVSGVRVREAYENGRKLKELHYLDCEVTLSYDNGVPEYAVEKIAELFCSSSVIVPKKTKNGIQDQDIIPMIKSIDAQKDGNKILLYATVHCQNPSLNPSQLAAAISMHLPMLKPDYVFCRRLELRDESGDVFR